MQPSKRTETTVELKGVHLCCEGCVNGVYDALKGVEGVKSHCDMENGTATLTASDDAGAQKALDALAAAGFHGDTGNTQLAMKAESHVPQGKVKRLKVSGIHNCCQPCCEAIEGGAQDRGRRNRRHGRTQGDQLRGHRRLRCRRAGRGAQRRRLPRAGQAMINRWASVRLSSARPCAGRTEFAGPTSSEETARHFGVRPATKEVSTWRRFA